MRVQNVFLMMNPRSPKLLEDVKYQIKSLIWKVCIFLVYFP